MEDLQKEVCEELIHSLYEWGVNRSDGKHVRFRQRAIRDCVANLSQKSQEPINYEALKSERFPKDYGEAYAYVLRHDDVPDKLYSYIDKLNGVGFLEPFRRWRDRRTGEIKRYHLKTEYQGFSSEQLDPLDRFQFNPMTKEELFFERWVVGDEDDAARDGVFMEAILACHALKSESCYNCKFQKALRWNGGGSASWQDIICTNCGAMYEVKTKANMEKVETSLRWNNFSGGSFSAWCQLRNSKRKDQKMYLVVLPRKSTSNRHSRKVFPVTIAEIDKVLPKTSHGSFNPNYQSVGFKSSVSLKLNTKANWFDLPVTGEIIEMGEIAVQIFKDRFSEETFNRLEELHFGNDSSDDNKKDQGTKEVEVADSVNGITNELEKVELVPDDWEDLASDSD